MKKSIMKSGNKKSVTKVDDSRSGIEFLKIPKPAQRALFNHGINTIADLSKRTKEDIQELHGIGPSAFPVLEQALRQIGLTFKKSK